MLWTIILLMKFPHHLTDFFCVQMGICLSSTMGNSTYVAGTEFFVRMIVDDTIFGYLQEYNKMA